MLRSRKMRVLSTAHPVIWERFLLETTQVFINDRSAGSILDAATAVVVSEACPRDALMGHILTNYPGSRYHFTQARDASRVIAAYAANDIRARNPELNVRENQRAIASDLKPFKLFWAARKGGGYADVFYAHLVAATYLMVTMKSNPDWTLEIYPAQR